MWANQGAGVKVLDPVSIALLTLIILDTLRRNRTSRT